jgi:TonB family protein
MRWIAFGVLVYCASGPLLAIAQTPDVPSETAVQPHVAAGFTDSSGGFQRFPGIDARYLDGDAAVSGAADPRWKPWDPSSVELARVMSNQPGANPRHATQHAFLLSLRGDRSGAEAGIAAAKQRFPDSEAVYWSEGWIRLNLLDFEGSLLAWQQAERLHGGQPYWVPYSKAIALIGLGDQAAALAWWGVAQRSHGPELASADAARAKFQHWRFTEKLLLEDLIQAAFPGTERLAVVDGSETPYLKVLSAPTPSYPPSLLRMGIQGETLVRMRVGPDGVPGDVAIQRSSGQSEFDAVAIDAARLARFSMPEKVDSKGVIVLLPYRFSLRADPAAAALKDQSELGAATGQDAEMQRMIERRREKILEAANSAASNGNR